MKSLADILSGYGLAFAGTLLGLLAKYGLLVSEGAPIRARSIYGDLLTMGLLAVLARYVVDASGVTGNNALLAAGMIALASDRVLRFARELYLHRLGLKDRPE